MNKPHFPSLDKFKIAKRRTEKLKSELDSFNIDKDDPCMFEVGKVEFIDTLNHIMTLFNVGVISFAQLCILLALAFEVLERINEIDNEYFKLLEKDLDKALKP